MTGSLQWTVIVSTYFTNTYITLHHITLHSITLHYTTLYYTTLHDMTWHDMTWHDMTLHYITLHYIHIYIHIHVIPYNKTYTSYNYITRPFVHPYCPTAIIFQLVLGAEYPWDPKEVDAEQHSLDAMHGGYRIHPWWCIGCHLSMISCFFFPVTFLFLLGINGFWLKGIYQVWEWTKASIAIMCKIHNMHHHWTVRNLRNFATCASLKCKPITLSLTQFCLWLLIVALFKGMRWEKNHPRITSSNTPPAALIFKPRFCMICGKVT